MDLEHIALQLFTIRDSLGSTKEIASALRRVRSIGYRAIEAAFLNAIDLSEFKKIADGEGLRICSLHEASNFLLNEPLAVIDRLDVLECKHVVYPYPTGYDFHTAEDVMALRDRLIGVGDLFQRAGRVFSYHHHAFEFVKYADTTVLDALLDEESLKWVKAQIDTHWVQRGGRSPVEYIGRFSGNLPSIHLKDYLIDLKNTPLFTEVGYGNLDIGGIICAARNAGVEWYIVEQDLCYGEDPFECSKRSFDFLVKQFVGGKQEEFD